MKIVKIIIGFLLLFGTGKEYINASRQLGSFFSPGIVIVTLLMLLLSTWLMGSGFSQRKLTFKSFEFIKFFVITLIIFFIIAFFSLSSYVIPDNFHSINGINIPMNKCINGSERIIENKKEREKYCICIAQKITANSSIKEKYQSELEKGQLVNILMELQKEEIFTELGIDSCFGNTELKWTDNIAKSIKSNWIKELRGSEFELTNDVEVYCDCLLSEYRKYPLSKIMEDDFQESELAISIENNCKEKSKK